MPRHRFPAGNGITCFIGWDRPIGSYFAQIEGGPNPDDDSSPLSKFRHMGYGANIGQTIETVEEIVGALGEAGITVPADIVEQLRAEKSPERHPHRPSWPIAFADEALDLPLRPYRN